MFYRYLSLLHNLLGKVCKTAAFISYTSNLSSLRNIDKMLVEPKRLSTYPIKVERILIQDDIFHMAKNCYNLYLHRYEGIDKRSTKFEFISHKS